MPEQTLIFFFKLLTCVAVAATLGSFVTMLVYRLPRGLSIVQPRSFCPSCKNTLEVRDLFPVASYLIYKGHCRQCGAEIPARYLWIEAGFMLVGVVVAFLI
jgi:leader peptidase (prepilin peptidase)/N-methyltransferase